MQVIIRYFRNKSEGHKRGTTALVEDKLTVTGNRSATRFRVQTTSGILSVDEELYDKLAKNDKLIIFRPIFGQTPLSVITMDQSEYYL